MPRLSDALALYLGSQTVTAAYKGSSLVWELSQESNEPRPFSATAVRSSGGFHLTSATVKTQFTASLGGTPLVGHLLIVTVNIDKTAGTIATPTGWTKTAEYVSPSTTQVMFHKVVTNPTTDSSVSISWATARAAAWAMAEYDCYDAVFEGAAIKPSDDTTRTATTLAYPAIDKNTLALATWGIDSATDALRLSETEPVNSEQGWTRTARFIGIAQSTNPSDNGGSSVLLDAKVVTSNTAGTVTFNHPTANDQTAMIIARFSTSATVSETPPPVEDDAVTVSGVEVGAVTSDSAVVAYDIETATTSRIVVSPTSDFSADLVYGEEQPSSTTAKCLVTGLQPNQKYYWKVEADGTILNATQGEFTTTPVVGTPASFEIVVASCSGQNTSPYISGKMSNSPSYDAMRSFNPLFFLNMGDEHYLDYAGTDVSVRILNRKNSRSIERRRNLNLKCWQIFNHDDHDGCGNNWGGDHVGVPTMLEAYSQTFPHYPLVSGTMAQTTDVGRVKFIVLDPRSKRTASSILGATQLAWLQDHLSTTTARVVVISTSLPWIGAGTTGSDYADNWQAFPAERELVAKAITAYEARTQGRVILVAGDAHMIAMDDGTNSQYDTANTNAGPPVYQFAPMDCTSSSKGGPYSLGIHNNHRYQFGRMVFEDDGTTITVTSEGHRVDVTNPAFPTTVVVSHIITVPEAGEIVEPNPEEPVDPPVEDPEAPIELLTNGTFDTNANGWSTGNGAILSVTDGVLKLQKGSSSNPYMYRTVNLEAGKTYTFKGSVVEAAEPTASFRIGTSAANLNLLNSGGSGVRNWTANYTSPSNQVVYYSVVHSSTVADSFIRVDDLSVKEAV